ncbi:phosphoribosylamine--glycine ligase [Archaeoglobus sulfaticallidus PM70-1]|uniref:Phosphoribosylamine--glycine ligase n=1 Tax=Archaeoglobus sulfaticallidus PM70-1 TaxID=387631 RepID=N0BEP8_9EURY|nr:phosphoribosylamine--glycine ligase [Archaeoglobus sulfaticallidus]AGK62104.1 phosphoribosylamine--glycine ligase [Archaeoglobus sulfaticallidus PM70-1]
MRVLVVDAGGRGNAIAHAFSRSETVKEVYVAPGNGGSEFFDKCRIAELNGKKIPSIRAVDEIVEFAKKSEVDLVFVGPEEPLSLGLVDRLEEEGINAVGPRKQETILEASKCWAKDFMRKIGVPIPEYWNFDDAESAKEFVKEFYRENPDKNLVVKADGLAAGKGVYVCDSVDECLKAIDEIMIEKKFGSAGNKICIEERLYGIEVAFTALSDGKNAVCFGHAKDYKRAFDPDDLEGLRNFYIGYNKKFISLDAAKKLFEEGKLLNPNTGGMGAVSPHPFLNEELESRIMDEVVNPIIRKFRELEGKEFRGVLYPVIMLVREGDEFVPKVLEINVRDCDPGAEAKLPRLKSDIAELSMAILEGRLKDVEVEFSNRYCVAVCAVSGFLKGREGLKPGYPSDHYTNQPITGIETAMSEDTFIYANGISKANGYQTTGGRVLTVSSLADSLEEARKKSYDALSKISFPGMRYRKTIGMDVPD